MQNAKCKTDAAERGQRLLANYAEPQGGKACEAGLMQNAKFSAVNRRNGTYGTNETYVVRSQTHHPLVPLVLLVLLVSSLLRPLSTLNYSLLSTHYSLLTTH